MRPQVLQYDRCGECIHNRRLVAGPIERAEWAARVGLQCSCPPRQRHPHGKGVAVLKLVCVVQLLVGVAETLWEAERQQHAVLQGSSCIHGLRLAPAPSVLYCTVI